MKLISNEEIEKRINKYYEPDGFNDPQSFGEEIAQAQLDADTQKVREILAGVKAGIESYSAVEKLPYRDGGGLIRTIPDSAWQSFWEEVME